MINTSSCKQNKNQQSTFLLYNKMIQIDTRYLENVKASIMEQTWNHSAFCSFRKVVLCLALYTDEVPFQKLSLVSTKSLVVTT